MTLVGIHSGAVSCGSKRKKDLPAWWVRVSYKVCVKVINCDVLGNKQSRNKISVPKISKYMSAKPNFSIYVQ